MKSENIVYLDNAATTRMDPVVVEHMTASMKKDFANSGTVYSLGLDAKNAIEQCREEIASCLHLPSRFRIVFTSGGSESNNLFVKGLCFPDKKTAYTGLEHPSLVESLESLRAFGNVPVCLKEGLVQGRLQKASISRIVEERVRLLCLSHINNETGIVQDVESLATFLYEASPKTRLFIDGVQAVGKMNYSEHFWKHISGYSISAHKFHGPKGIGLLIYDSRLELAPQIHGGKQQYGVRSGTLPLPLIMGMTHALKLASQRTSQMLAHFKSLRDHLVSGLKALEKEIPSLQIRFNSLLDGDLKKQSPAILNFSFPPVEGEVVLHHLEHQNIFVGLGSACSAHSKEPSRILLGMGCTREEALCSLRISFEHLNTIHDVDQFLTAFCSAYQALYPTFQNSTVPR